MGVSLGRSGALRIYYTGPQLNDQQTHSLVSIQLAHEDLLYRVARSGGRGRSLSHKRSFARPLSSQPAIVNGSRSWYGVQYHRLGLNTSQGNLEFRYFDSSLNAAAVQANVALALGMVGAAMDGRLQDDSVHRPGVLKGLLLSLVPSSRWNRLVQETVGQGPIADQLSRQR